MTVISIKTINEMNHVAKMLLVNYPQNKIFAVTGNMGAGKTTLIKALCKELGVSDNASSPTFSIVNEYNAANNEKIFHFDFYRIKNVSEVFDIGYQEYLYSGVYCFIEWPEKIQGLLPKETINVTIEVKDEERIIKF
ncbi:MAG: tRNA (adenosine(37)-N6)-threonylcarbamoyltransferase complex ATPase subunit type 1 TsaE [Bacteroidia bacterium]|nr:tRNA (adenosine(37)-N6)-threonylcarbamoyltransferase complex ATPase subunit type 1 TsaE [Bacteroidia bacterium]